MPAKSKAQQSAAGIALAVKEARKAQELAPRRFQEHVRFDERERAQEDGFDEPQGKAGAQEQVEVAVLYLQPFVFAAFSWAASNGSAAMVESTSAARWGSIPPAMR